RPRLPGVLDPPVRAREGLRRRPPAPGRGLRGAHAARPGRLRGDLMAGAPKSGPARSGRTPRERLELAAMGMEAEFELWLDGERVRPEDAFGDPRAFVRGPLVHRTGTSYHLPTGGAIYFDTGVIELATPVIEIERGCAARAVRSLWAGIRFVRDELSDCDARTGHQARLAGFSTPS